MEIAVPLEAKGQWHRDVWFIAEIQLDRYYSIERNTAIKGFYVVFWFGLQVPTRRKFKNPLEEILKPPSAEEMRLVIQTSLPKVDQVTVSHFDRSTTRWSYVPYLYPS